MKTNIQAIATGLALTIAGSALAPLAASADQNSKNNWRNGAIGGAALGVAGLATHNTTLGVIGLGAAAYSASRYEQDRRHQSQENSRRQYYHHYYGNNGGDNQYYSYGGHQYRYNRSTGVRIFIR